MLRRLIRLRADIRAQEAVLAGRQHLVAASYKGLKAGYRRRLASPSVLLTSLVSGLIAGMLARRPRRESRMPWLKLSRTVMGPAVLYVLRNHAAQWLRKAGL